MVWDIFLYFIWVVVLISAVRFVYHRVGIDRARKVLVTVKIKKLDR